MLCFYLCSVVGMIVLLLIGCAALYCVIFLHEVVSCAAAYACVVPGVGCDLFLVHGYIFIFLLNSWL